MVVTAGRRRTLRSLLLLALLAPGLVTALPQAGASDLESLRDRAQALADQVTKLEHRLDSLNGRRARLESEIETSSSEIGLMELRKHDLEADYREAIDSYVGRAVEAYKDGSTTRLALMLSSQNLTQLFTIAEATLASAEQDADALERLTAARQHAEATQAQIDERKQKLLMKQAAVEAVASEIDGTLSARRAVFERLAAEIDELERQAREAARLAARPDAAFLKLLGGTGPTLDIPKGFVGTGVTFEGIASWYGPGFEGNPTASGDIFDPSLFTAASKELPLGSWLFVQHNGKGVVVLVNDRGPYVDDRVLDLSQAAAEAIGITGLGWIRAEVLLKA